jgi:hypothetical protein
MMLKRKSHPHRRQVFVICSSYMLQHCVFNVSLYVIPLHCLLNFDLILLVQLILVLPYVFFSHSSALFFFDIVNYHCIELILSSLTADGKGKATTTEAGYNNVLKRGYLN